MDAWTSWLQAQSAAGTPVTILYRRLEPEVTQGEARSLSQSDGTLNVSATGTRSGVLEGTEAEVTYTYQPDMNDVLTRLAEVETQLAALTANQ